jgi:hypothetical protein
MVSRSHKTTQHPEPAWIGFAKFLWIALLVVMVFLLAHTMVRHDFFTGGGLNYRSTTTHP